MSKVNLDNVFVVGNVYKLTTIPHKIHSNYEDLKSLLGTEFKLLGTDNSDTAKHCSLLWKSISNNKVYAIRAALFLNSDRFFYVTTQKNKQDAKACMILRNLTLKSTTNNTETSVRLGTIFTQYYIKGTKVYVTAENGKEYYTSSSNICEVTDIEGTPSQLLKCEFEQPLDESVKDVAEISPMALETKAKALDVEIKEVHVYNVLGLQFNSLPEAEAALKMYKHLNA